MVEGTAGNTGIGLAHMCNALGYKCVIFMPDTQSQVRHKLASVRVHVCNHPITALVCICISTANSKWMVDK